MPDRRILFLSRFRELAARAMRVFMRPRLLVTGIVLALTGCGDGPPAFQPVRVGDRLFHLELALTTRQRVRGLSDRDSLQADGGMLFVFTKPEVVRFVMRRCKIPLDILFLAPDGRIVAMHEMVTQPYDTPDRNLPGYSSGEPAQFAIELPAGTLKQLNVFPGQVIDLPIEELKGKVR